MPIPGPRTQHGPVPGYRNPSLQQRTQHGESYRWTPHSAVGPEIPGRRFHRWNRPAPVADMGRSPGLQWISLRGNVLGHGLIRRYWRQLVNYIPAPPAYSQAASSPYGPAPRPMGITRALRYRTLCISPTAGTDNTRFPGLHTKIIPQVRSHPVTRGAGQVRSRPTIRNRISSFGSRVPAINQRAPASTNNPEPGQ